MPNIQLIFRISDRVNSISSNWFYYRIYNWNSVETFWNLWNTSFQHPNGSRKIIVLSRNPVSSGLHEILRRVWWKTCFFTYLIAFYYWFRLDKTAFIEELPKHTHLTMLSFYFDTNENSLSRIMCLSPDYLQFVKRAVDLFIFTWLNQLE